MFGGKRIWLVIMLMVVLVVVACTAAANMADSSDALYLTVPLVEAKAAPTATPSALPEHWLLAVGETASLLCGGTPKAEGVPAGELSVNLNGVDSLEFSCAEWEGGASAAATPGETTQHWQLSHHQVGYALCGGEALNGTPAGQWEFKINGVDSVEVTCMEWEGGE